MNNKYKTIAIMGVVCFPNIPITCEIGKQPSKDAIINAYENKENILLVTQTTNSLGSDFLKCVNTVGTVCKIKQVKVDNNKNTIKLVADGIKRVLLKSVDYGEKYTTVETVDIIEEQEINNVTSMLLSSAKEKFVEYVSLNNDFNSNLDIVPYINNINDVNTFVNSVGVLVVKDEKRQLELLNEISAKARLEKLIMFILEGIEILKLNKKLSDEVRMSMDKNQKDYYLREQMKAISKELGDVDDEFDELEKKINNNKVPKEVKEKALKELSRLKKLPTQSPEYTILRNYLDEIISVPWGVYTTDCKDLTKAKQILDQDHYGLEKVKERIIENLAIMQLTGKVSGQIICFVGPPGVGKTSIARSIARALNRNFVKMSVGGVKDESEIRGHRKTYVGAMPGRIIYNLKQAKSMNPVFLVDEIDKMTSNSNYGDPSSAMLEVLDPEQNYAFRDNYLEVPVDLSKVLFIATANYADKIPPALYDRMEVIELSSYLSTEKFFIAKNHLIPKEIEKNGLTDKNISFEDDAIRLVIEEYTSEAGVRGLERQIATICRKVAVKIINQSKEKCFVVTKQDVKEYLGGKKNYNEEKRSAPEVGVVSGMAYTSIGGTILNIECVTTSGEGKINLTGKLGDVMQESAQVAHSAIRSLAQTLGLDEKLFTKKNFHIHVPEGATPKNGPSAGGALATVIYSVVANKKIDNNVAITGEITIRGNILPIGGLKEKLSACIRAGIENAIIPLANKSDFEELPDEIKNNINITFASNILEVLDKAIIKE